MNSKLGGIPFLEVSFQAISMESTQPDHVISLLKD